MTNVPVDDSWVVVFEAVGEAEAQIVKSKLESYGLPVRMSSESVSRLFGLTTGPLAKIQLYVPESQEGLARSLLSDEETGGE